MYEIKVKIHEEADLYSSLDPDREQLDMEVVSYILHKYQEKKRKEPFCIHIFSDTPVDEERVRKNFRAFLEREEKNEEQLLHISSMKQVRLFAIGLAFIAIWLLVKTITNVLIVEILSIIGSFAIWEASNIWIVEKPNIRLKRHRLRRLMDTEIRFTVQKEAEEK